MILPLLSVQFSYSVMPSSWWPRGLQHTRLRCPSPTPLLCHTFNNYSPTWSMDFCLLEKSYHSWSVYWIPSWATLCTSHLGTYRNSSLTIGQETKNCEESVKSCKATTSEEALQFSQVKQSSSPPMGMEQLLLLAKKTHWNFSVLSFIRVFPYVPIPIFRIPFLQLMPSLEQQTPYEVGNSICIVIQLFPGWNYGFGFQQPQPFGYKW